MFRNLPVVVFTFDNGWLFLFLFHGVLEEQAYSFFLHNPDKVLTLTRNFQHSAVSYKTVRVSPLPCNFAIFVASRKTKVVNFVIAVLKV